jgi:hypothetical protein
MNRLNALPEQLQNERRTVSFDSYDITIRQLLEMFARNELDIAPEYQRRFVWDIARQSELVESAFLGIPIPSLYMATNADATWELVDGVQRLCTLINYCADIDSRNKIGKTEPPLKIEGLEKLDTLNGHTFGELPSSIQLTFLTRPLKVTVLNDKSDLHVRFDLFERLNTGGVALTQQEVRNCIYQGPFNDLLKKYAAMTNFRAVAKLKESDKNNGTYEELALRFFAYFERYKEFDHSVKDFLNDYMRDKLQLGPHRKIRTLFSETFEFLSAALPSGVVRGGRAVTPVNLFEAVAVGTALAIEAAGDDLDKKIVRHLLEDQKLRKLTTGATNSRRMVTDRIHYVRDALIDL